MKTVAIASLKGGVGKTTTAANLGAALAQREGGGVLLVDCDPRNQLGIHFGLPADALGLGQASLRGAGWERAARMIGSDGLTCVPFGGLEPDSIRELESILQRRPELLREGLADPVLARRVAIIDTPPWPSELLERVLPLAQLAVIVLHADPASFATLPSLLQLLERHPRVRAQLLLNCVDGTRLQRDVRALLAAQPQVSVLPFAIHRDQAVPEALAAQRTVLESAPGSQAADDFRRAAEWLEEALASVEKPAVSERSEPRVPEPPRVSGARS